MAKIPIFKTVNVTKQYELGDVTVDALAGVNLEIYSGEFICIFGPSGCGKSTLLSIIAGLQQPSAGEVYLRGEKLTILNNDDLAKYRRSKIGMIFQSFNLIHSMNIVENVALPLGFAGIPKGRRMKRAEDLLDMVGLGKYKDHTPAQLSGGQQQRVAIARSMVNAPWIMLADEPTGNLDSKSANEVMRLLISLNRKSKRTVILITHNPDYLDYADRIFFLQDGKVVKTKVNSRVKKIEEVEGVGQIREDLDPNKEEEDNGGNIDVDKVDESSEKQEEVKA
jgi:putative ABC transport system ATP-binding protein